MGILLLVLPITIFIASWYFIQHLVRNTRNLPPSPFSVPIIGHLHLLQNPLHQTLSKISDRFGPVLFLRLGRRRTLHVASPSAAEDCLRQNDIVFANRPNFFTGDIFGYGSETLIWAPYGSYWRTLRRIPTVQIFSPHSLQITSGLRSNEVRFLIRRIFLESSEDPTVEIGAALFQMTQNVMMRVMAKERYEGEESKRFREVMGMVMNIEGTSTIVDVIPWLRFFGVKGILRKRFRFLVDEKEKFLDELMAKHRRKMEEEEEEEEEREERENRTLIGVLLELQRSEPELYRDEMIKGLFQVLLLAGTDTTAGTIEWALTLMLNNPMVLKKAQHEIDLQVGSDRLVEESDLNKLPYLRCIINETLRLYPVAPLLIPHQSSETCIVRGYTVPSGTMLLVNVWAIKNDLKYWDEPKAFRPERFEGVEEDGEEMKYKFMPFGSGRRACPGKGMAMRMVGLALASLLQCFKWERPTHELVDVAVKTGLSSPKAHPLRAKCWARENIIGFISRV